MKYCALCCIARDEDKYIEEWVEYHLLLGVDVIIIYDNHSQVPLTSVLAKYVSDGKVIIHVTEGDSLGEKAQAEAYTHCMQTYKHEFMWIAVIDADEVIVPKKHTNIKQLLAEFENYGGVVLHWVFYGNANNDVFEKSQINSFKFTNGKRNTTIKSIVRPLRVSQFTGPHGPQYLLPYHAVNMEHFPLEPDVYSAPYAVEKAQINHYKLRTRDDWQKKVLKWKLSGLVLSNNYEDAVKAYTEYDPFAAVLFSSLQNKKLFVIPTEFDSVEDLTAFFITALEHKHLHDSLEILLCNCACKFHEEPMIWYFRSVISRLQNNNELALHFIKQASKLSGSSTIYFELSRVYAASGQLEHSRRAEEQAKYKKHIEDTTCA